jgi:cytochrome c peroxidase
MPTNSTHRLVLVLIASGGLVASSQSLSNESLRKESLPNLFPFPNANGLLETYNIADQPIDLTGPFFQSLGTNGRSCGSCHRPAQAWSVSPHELKLRFEQTQGRDPIFRTNDGSNCDHNIDTSTIQSRRKAYSLLLNKGLIRIALAAPETAEFDVVSVVNPYGCSDSSTLSMYRRPLPSTNLRFLSTVMADGRESSPQTGTQKITFNTNPDDLLADLAHQALDATNGHAQASTPLTAEQQHAIVDFEMSLITAQAYDYRAGWLTADRAVGGPVALAKHTLPAFFVGINDPLGGNPKDTPFTPVIFKLFNAWKNPNSEDNDNGSDRDDQQTRRARIARGEKLFNSKAINITGVAGLNDDLNLASIPGTCGTCHDSPNVGNHSVSAPLNIGVSDLDSPLDLSYLPVFTLRNRSTGEIKKTTDPGRALITGAWKDVGRLKGPILRGLPARAPYFHNGSAETLTDVIEFYDKRFSIGFTAQEKKDLIAFLNTL